MTAAATGCGEEAGGGLSQVDASPSLPGLCAPGAEACSDEGASACVNGGIRSCIEVAGCLQWGVVVACAPGSQCEDESGVATCVGGCSEAACTVPEARRCAPDAAGSYERCSDDDGDGCLDWGAATACPSGETCGQGGFCAAGCSDECQAGAKRCEGDGVVTCGQHDADDCVEWGEPEACPSACALGACVASCVDECAADELRRCDGASVDVCRTSADGCRRWVSAESCAPGTTCSAGLCSASCVDECQAGDTSCEGGGVVTCGDFDGDDCADRGLPVACDAGESCSLGDCAPIAQCEDECAGDAMRCSPSGLGVEACGQWDADACREWAPVAQCQAGESCSLGRCVAGCADECTLGERRCQPGSTTLVEVCAADADGDSCSEWTADEDCAGRARLCSSGSCGDTCADECDGRARCDGDAVVACGQLDEDSCRDLAAPVPCEDGTVCVEGQTEATCEAVPAPGGLLISEVLFNAEGPDDDTFIEIAGAPGTALSGFSLVAINGDTGAPYASLALVGTIPADGLFVVGHPQANDAIAGATDQLSTFADLQNGPDNLVLQWGEDVVDALGYGSFKPDDVFRGEGQAAQEVNAGHSLARIGELQDTDNNRNDFADMQTPTPGAPFLAARRPSLLGDLVVTEIMADPKALSDLAGEWFELFNPRAGATFELQGCVIESDPNERYTIDESLVVPPNGRVVLARTNNAGVPVDHVYSGISLNNGIDSIAVLCDDVLIDEFVWLETVPNGLSMSVDPSFENAAENDAEGAWCPAPVAPAQGKDAATAGDPNPPCPNQSGLYQQTALDSQWGACDEAPDWQAFAFDAAPEALGDATLDFQWWSVLCPGFATTSDVWIELSTGQGTWTEVAHASFTTILDACSWQVESTAIAASVINAARATSGRVEGRVRIQGGCPQGIGCGIVGQIVPNNCTRRLALSYPY